MATLSPDERLLRPAAGRAPALPRPMRRAIRLPARLSWMAWLGLLLVGSTVAVALLANVLAPVSPWTSVARPFQPPSLAHPLGTDDLGRDLLAGVIHGARTSLVVALAAASLATAIGVLLGAAAGYGGGLLDDGLMRLTEFFQVLPRFFLALVAVALFKPGLVTIALVLGLTSWPMTARLLRAQVLSVREREYVLAARALGAGPLAVLRRHVLPNSVAPIVVHTSLMIGQVILTEISLSFLGLGDPNHISWGYLMANAQAFLRLAWWLPLFPGLATVLTVLGFNLVGDALNEVWLRRQSGGYQRS
jgi:peptide/nickel transport system permease protein